MFSPGLRQHLPILSAGIAGWITDFLRRAGVPVREFVAEAKDRNPDTPRLAFPLLFDSRTRESREAASSATRLGATKIDISRFSPPTKTPESVSAEWSFDHNMARYFIDWFKTQLERHDFLWTRLADAPHPYQAITFRDAVSADWRTGLGNRVADRAGIQRDLNWHPGEAEFPRWRQFRQDVKIRCQSNEHMLHVQCEFPDSAFRPALEIWRGAHFARIPMQPGVTSIPVGFAVFQTARDRHPAGNPAAFQNPPPATETATIASSA